MEVVMCPSPRCRGVTISISEFVKHARNYHSEEGLYFSCPSCDKAGFQFKGLESHYYRHHHTLPKHMKVPPSAPAGSDNPSASGGNAAVSETSDAVSDPCGDAPCSDAPLSDVPLSDAPLSDVPLSDAPLSDAPLSDAPLSDVPLSDAPLSDAPLSSEHFDEGTVIGSEGVRYSYTEETVTVSASDTEGCDIEVDSDNNDSDSETSHEVNASGEHPSDSVKKGAEFILTMKLVCGVNKTQSKTVLRETKSLMEFVCDSTIEKLSDAGVPVANVDRDKLKHDVCDPIFDDLNSTFLQERYFEKHYKVIKPKFVEIDRTLNRVGSGKRRKTVLVPKNFFYVPILEVLERLLQHPDYEAMILREVDEDPDVLDCYLKGSFAKENPILQQHPDALRVVLYYDDLETCQALGSKASGQQKLGAFYMTLDNIHPRFRASLSSICLVALADATFLKSEEGVDLINERSAKDLKKLECGVMLNGKITYGTLVGYTGDNLGIHQCGGFKSGFTAFKVCRTCNATPDDVHNLVIEDPMMLRTVEEYDRQIQELENAVSLKERDKLSRDFGITRKCPLNDLQSYHVLFGLPPDLMHDVLEGSLIRCVKYLIRYVVDELKNVTLAWLNEALKYFDYGYSEKTSKPSPIKHDHLKDDGNLRQSASQMWTLASVLPLILGPHMSPEDKHWKNFILLLEIMRMIFSDSINKNLLPHLASMIATYLSGYKSLYGHLLPKDHFMIHYPRFLSCYGTLRDFMCMRMEATHQFFKRQVYTLRNYKNIPKSLALTFQLNQAFRWSKPLIKKPDYGVLTRRNISQVPYAQFLSGVSEFVESSWVKAEGFLFKSGDCYICVGSDSFSRPVFAGVLHIVVWPELVLVCHGVVTEHYDTHLSAYKIRDTADFRCHKIADVEGRTVFHGHYVDQEKFIVLKECVGDSF